MARKVYYLDTVASLSDVDFTEPVRLVLPSPRRGGPALREWRAALMQCRARFSGTTQRLFADVDPDEADSPILALDTIARSDADGLERMILSVLPHVDEIVLGIDSRSDEETLKVAEAYADTSFVFGASDIKLSVEEWTADKIHFANARNLGRSRVRAPWTLVIDSDEYVAEAGDVRAQLRATPATAEGCETYVIVGAVKYDDHQRLARTSLRWQSAAHNQLPHAGIDGKVDLLVIEDKTFRAANETARRDAQRNLGIDDLVDAAARGDLSALFHIAKHRAHHDDPAVAAKLVENYRLRIEPHSALADERAWLALGMAFRYYNEDKLPEADMWAVRALLDGPRTVAFCLLGDIAEDQGDLERARGWYECACAYTDTSKIAWPGIVELRWGRLAGIRLALAGHGPPPEVTIVESDAAFDAQGAR